MSSGLVGEGKRLYRMWGRPYIEVDSGEFPIDMSQVPESVSADYSNEEGYRSSVWSRLHQAGVDRVRWTNGPLRRHLLGETWVSDEAFETLQGLADNVYSFFSLIFDDGTSQRRYHRWSYRVWPAGSPFRDENGRKLSPWVLHDRCEPPVSPAEVIAAADKKDGDMIVALPSFVDRNRIMFLDNKPVVTESFVTGWRESAVGREIVARGEPDLDFSDWQLRRATGYRWFEAEEPDSFEMEPERWFPPGSMYPEPRPKSG